MKPHKVIQDFVGKGMGVKLADDALNTDAGSGHPFNCPPVDIMFGGGSRQGRIYELYGAESAGKSLFALEMVKAFAASMEASKENMWGVLWVESENTFDKARAISMDVPIERFIFFETDVFEDGRDKIGAILKRAKEKKMQFMIVWDTIAATTTRNEKIISNEAADDADGEVDDSKKSTKSKSNPGGMVEKPRLIRKMFHDITVSLGETNSIFIVVNQVTTQVGKYGAPLDSSGGFGLRHHASVRAKMVVEDREYMPNDSDKVKALITRIEFKKNKVTGFDNCNVHVHLHLETGLDPIETRFLCWKSRGILPKSAGSYTTIEVPSAYSTKAGDVPKKVQVKFQNVKQFSKIVSEQPWALDWLDYQTYLSFAKDSVLLKVKNIKKIWDYEKRLLGQVTTELSDKEKRIAEVLYDDMAKQDVKEADKFGKKEKK